MNCLSIPLAWLTTNLVHRLWIERRRRRWEHGVCRDANGVALDAVPYTIGNGDDALLLVHGFADTPAVFRDMAETLATQHGLTCRAMRLPGAGEPLTVAARQTCATWLAAVRSETAALRTSHRRVWIAGHSMGGALALLAQLETPTLADGLILLAPLVAVSPARAPLLSPRLWFRIAQIALPCSRTFESCFSVNVLTHDGAAIAYTRDRFIPFATYSALFRLTDRLHGRAAELQTPLFAVFVAGDRIVDTAAARAWIDTCQAPRRQSETIDGCGHAIMLETNLLPQLCQRIIAFINNGT